MGRMDAVALVDRVTESDAVRRWRLEALRRAGYMPWDALILCCREDVDLHRAVALLEQGCPRETALRILL